MKSMIREIARLPRKYAITNDLSVTFSKLPNNLFRGANNEELFD